MKFTKSLSNYDDIWSMCAALTNNHIMKHPLQIHEDDSDESQSDFEEEEEETTQ